MMEPLFRLHVMTHYDARSHCSHSPAISLPAQNDIPRCRGNSLRCISHEKLLPLPFPACQELLVKKKKKSGRCRARYGVFVGVCHVSPRLAMSGCADHFPPVRLIRHPSEEATARRAFASCVPADAEMMNELVERGFLNPPRRRNPPQANGSLHTQARPILSGLLAHYTAGNAFSFIKYQPSVL